ncbi:MAG TPA: condensation domain-containing protein, partial [Longimicrobiaceae bacterium]|nr:condensation domain-containing protein [Longimicrobiaceae bacterium]
VLTDEADTVGGLARALREEPGFTLVKLTPAHLGLLAEQLTEAEAAAAARTLVVGGEALPAELAAYWRRVAPGTTVVNEYGPTETVVGCIVYRKTDAGGGAGSVPIGRPIAGTRAYVAGAGMQPVPTGVPGELYLGGAQVGRGYGGRPGLTAERFVPDPFGSEPGARLYRTGDRVRWLASGEMEYLGRTDFQVKVRGFRIEPGEVESALLEHPAAREALVMQREDAPGQRQLVAYVVPADGAGSSVPELRAHLHAVLPEHMVPAAFVVLESLPLTPNGKVDRRALPKPEQGGAPGRVAPRTATEVVLAGIWADVLGVENVWADDNFFELGGHSLLVTRVVSRVRKALGVKVPLRTLFDVRTVSALARRIDDLRSDGSPAAPPVRRVPRDGPLPLSFAQQRLWVTDRLEPGSAAYNMPHALRMRGDLDAAALRASIGELVRRHESLRTVFEERGGVPVQVVRPAAQTALPAMDLHGLPEAARAREVRRLAQEEALRPFDLARGPLLRSTLLRLGDRDHVLLFTLHHVVSDGWSMEVLVREVSALYAAFSRGEPSPLPELPVQYADFAVWQREWLTGETLAEQIGWWRERLAGAPPLLEVPTDRPRSAWQSPRAARHGFALSAELSRRLRALSRAEGATLFMTMLAAWQALLGRWSGQDDVVVGTPIAGRTTRETEGLIGFFVNMLALRAELGGETTWAGLLGRVREEALGAYAHQELPFERLVEELNVERSLAHSPVFQAVFTLDRPGERAELLRLGGLALEPFGSGEGIAKCDLDLVVADDTESLAGSLVYRAALYEPETMARMAGHLEAMLEAMTADPRARLSEVPLLRGAERARVLEAWNATAADFPRACIHEMFAAQAARTPDAPAVLFADQALTYAELQCRAGRLANHLRRLGVGPEARVGICLERSAETVVAILGVLQAGGAYLPLDPAYPPERLRHMLADSGAAVVLTTAELAGRVEGHAGDLVLLDAEREALAGEPGV